MGGNACAYHARLRQEAFFNELVECPTREVTVRVPVVAARRLSELEWPELWAFGRLMAARHPELLTAEPLTRFAA